MRRWLLAIAWYALMPPLSGGLVDVRAPLAQWEQMRAFDSAEECEKMMMAYARQFADQTDNATRIRYRQIQYVRCVSASDVRLREAGK